MQVALRKRNQGGKTSLYLDFYHKGKRRTESLKLYLHPKPKTAQERTENKKTLEIAETIRAKRQIEMQNDVYGLTDREKIKGEIIPYFRNLTEKRKESEGNYGNWRSMLVYLERHVPTGTTFERLDRDFVIGFREYLNTEAKTKSNKLLSQNSKHSYFNKFRAGIKQAHKDGIIPINPADSVEGIKQGEPEREFLTLEELQAVAKEECEIPRLKDAFLFSCLSGLRWSDVNKLTWKEVQHSNEIGYYIRFTQKKTKGVETLPISEQAYEYLGEPQDKDDRVFVGLKYSVWLNLKLQQ